MKQKVHDGQGAVERRRRYLARLVLEVGEERRGRLLRVEEQIFPGVVGEDRTVLPVWHHEAETAVLGNYGKQSSVWGRAWK